MITPAPFHRMFDCPLSLFSCFAQGTHGFVSFLSSLHYLHLQFGVFVASTHYFVVSFFVRCYLQAGSHSREKHLLASSCLSVRMTAFIVSASTGRIFVNFDIGDFY